MRSANYVEETTTSIAGASGNGAVTLTAIASTPRFSTVFGTQATTIRYVIEDTVGKKFETGIGSVAANVLTRTRPQVTWDGTTYDDSTPSPIAFGSAPVSGDIRVRLAATAENSGPVLMPGVNRSVASSDDTLRDYRLSGSIFENGGTEGFKTADRLYYAAYLLEHAGSLDGVLLPVVTGVATGAMKMGIYDISHAGVPVNLLATFNTADITTSGSKVDTATGTWTPSGPVWLTPGWYALAMLSNVAARISGGTGAPVNARPTPFGRQNGYGFSDTIYVSRSYASGLPAVADMTGAVLAAAQSADNARTLLRLRVTP